MGKVRIIYGVPTVDPASVIDLTAVRLDGGSGSVLVNSGVPLKEGQLDPADIGNVSLWLDTGSGLAEVSCYVEVLASRPSTVYDGSAWSVLVQWTGDPDNIQSAELRLTGTPGQSRLTETTPRPAEPAAMFIPTSATHLRDCDIFPYPITLNDDLDTDFSGLSALYSDAYHHATQQSDWQNEALRVKYYGGASLYQWVFMNGPSVTNCADFLNAANDVGNAAADGSGNRQTYNDVCNSTCAIHYLLTGYEQSRTTVGKYACRLIGEPWSDYKYEGGGRHIYHAIDAGMWAYLLDVDDVSRGVYGPYTRSEWMTKIEEKVNAWKSGWDSGAPSLPTPIEGFHNVWGIASYSDPSLVLSYMNAMMHVGVMRAFEKLAGISTTLDGYRSDWESGLINFCDVLLNTIDGFDDTVGVNVWVYSLIAPEGTTDIRWCGGWGTRDTAEAGTDYNTIHCTGLFTNASVGNRVYNKTRDTYTEITSITSNDEAEISPSISGQTSGDDIRVHDDEYSDYSHPGTTAWTFWWSGFVNNAFGYAKDAATGTQAASFKSAFRTGVETLISRFADPGTSNLWGTYNLGAGNGYYIGNTSIDEVGVNGIMGMGLSQSSPWLGESA